MDELFRLEAQKAGAECHVSVSADGFGLSVDRDGWPTRARNSAEAVRIARDYVGDFLEPADHGAIPWGLRVTVADGIAVYGDWPLAAPKERPDPIFQRTPLVRIRKRWHDSGPLSALDNAVEILRTYAVRTARRAA